MLADRIRPRPWTEFEIVEYLCNENNRDPAHFVGPQ